MPTALLIEPANGVPASVTPRCSGYGTFAASMPVRANHRRHVARLHRDLEVPVVEALEQPHLLERRLDERLGLVAPARAPSRCFGSEPEFAPMRIGIACALRGAHDLRDLVRAADVARVDADGRDAGVDRLRARGSR